MSARSMAPKSTISRRAALGALAGAAIVPPALAQPAVRRKVTISYWTWADNPSHQKMLIDTVDGFNKSQGFITVALDANMKTMEVRQKVVAAFAAGAAPDVAGVVQTHVQDYFDNDILAPIDAYFQKWDQKDDYFPSILTSMHSKPGQPLLYMPNRILPYVLYYRADWFDTAGLKAPVTYDEFIAAAKAITTPDRAGYALRGVDYYAVQPIEPIWGSAGVKFADEHGTVDFDGPAAVAVTDKWLGMYTRDKSAQPTAINDGYPQLFALMEKGRAAMWLYGTHASPQLMNALGDRIQATAIPRAGERQLTLANPEGEFMTSSCKERDAAWEFLAFLSNGPHNKWLSTDRGYLPVRKSRAADPAIEANRFFKLAMANAPNWWTPPFSFKNWANYQDKIAPYWQQALRQEITAAQWNAQAAKFLRGQA
jgi:multiple sugar transport system substrate-binding protein